MLLIEILSWTAVVLVLAAYASGNRPLYNWANLVLFFPVALPALIAHAYSSAAISIAFGCIGGFTIFKQWRANANS